MNIKKESWEMNVQEYALSLFVKPEGYFSKSHYIKSIEEYEQLKIDLTNKKIRPSKIIGTGYNNPRKAAFIWLDKQIVRTKQELDTFGLSNVVLRRNHEGYIFTALREGKTIPNKSIEGHERIIKELEERNIDITKEFISYNDNKVPESQPEPKKTPITLSEKSKKIIQELHQNFYQNIRLTPKPLLQMAERYDITDMDYFYEVAELAWTLYYRKIMESHPNDFDTGLEVATDFYFKVQPSYNQTNSNKKKFQQYSTAAPIGILAAYYTDAHKGSKEVFEPSAGNGLLTVAAPYSNVTVNELETTRLNNLKTQPFKKILNQDGTQPFIGYEKKFDAILSNPPFGSRIPVVNFDFDKYNISQLKLDHLMIVHALETMKDDGHAALIIGGWTFFKEDNGKIKNHRIFFNWLSSHYYIDDVININSKKLYNRQGTAYPLRMICISGRKVTPDINTLRLTKETSYLSEVVNTIPELKERIEAAKKRATQDRLTLSDQLKIEIEKMKIELA